MVIDCNGAVLVSSQAREVTRPTNSSAAAGAWNYTAGVADVLQAVDAAPNSRPWLPAMQAQLRSWGLIAPEGSYLTPLNASALLGPASSFQGQTWSARMYMRGAGKGGSSAHYKVLARRLDAAQTRGLPFVVVLCTRLLGLPRAK